MKHDAPAELVNGDARRALNTLEMMADMAEVDDSGKRVLKPELLTEIAGERSARFDNKGDRFYDLISALHKSVRGSAPDAALYWYAANYYRRWRSVICRASLPGNCFRRCRAMPTHGAMQVAIAAWDCFTRVGPAEGERAIAQAIVYPGCRAKKQRCLHCV